MKQAERRESISNAQAVYIYHNAIDIVGDKQATEDQVFEACEQAIREIKNLVRHVLTDEVKIICDKETAIQMDGELRRAKEFTFRIADEKINFFYPKELAWSKKEAVHSK